MTNNNSIANDSNIDRRQLRPGNEPVVTGDGVFAFALYMAGTPFADDNLWCVNYYTADILRKLGYSGIPMRDAATRAVKDGRPGVIRFMLCRPTPEVTRGYNEQQKEIDNGEGEARNTLRNLFTDYKSGVRSFEETAVRVVCLILKMRIKFMNGWKDITPLLRIDDSREPHRTRGLDGAETVEFGGFKFISANASEETRARMGV